MTPRLTAFLVGLTLVGFVVALAGTFLARSAAGPELAGRDTWAYWIVDPAAPYGGLAGTRGAFLYSPVLAWIMAPLALLPWDLVRDGWAVAQVALLILLAGPFALGTLFAPPVVWELTHGNITLGIAAVTVFGLRWPALWSLPILAKVTPAIGLLWFAFRGEWRSLAIALGATAALTVPVFVLAPDLWHDWVVTLYANGSVGTGWTLAPLPLRIAGAVLLLWVGARRGWRWVVPVAVMLSLGHLWLTALAILVAVIPLTETLGRYTPAGYIVGRASAGSGRSQRSGTSP